MMGNNEQDDAEKNAAIGALDYFLSGDREIENYDVEAMCLPVEIAPRLNACGSQYPNVEKGITLS